ncbi:MAG: DUF1638 domain-containing protein [Oscillospiraceae bacterium]|jgi:hypothetical protein|nr:DUF1638 domain-containing protein [Oscillospiraceae bacterium]
MPPKNLKIISCKVLYRDLSRLCAESDNLTDVTYMRQSLHNVPAKFRDALQTELDSIDGGEDAHTSYPPYDKDFDAILLGFGLCSGTVEGLRSKHTLVIPRVHDCIALFLGSHSRFAEFSAQNPGTYWYNRNWVEVTPVPGEPQHEALLKKYSARYDGARAEKLVRRAEEWREGYTGAAFIRSDLYDSADSEQVSQKAAEYIGWTHRTLDGDSTLLRDFIAGNWDSERFLVVPPGKTVVQTYDEKIIGTE